MKRPSFTLEINDKKYELKLTARAVVEVESKINAPLAEELAKNPSVAFVAMLITASNKELTMNDSMELIDEYLDEHNYKDLLTEVYKPLIETSGFFSKRTETK